MSAQNYASTMPHVMAVYGRTPLAFERGEGVRLYSTDGEAYLDCVAGIATNGLGHANPVLIEALTKQAQKLWHVSNIYRIPEQEELAKRLTDASFADVVFFANSGAEAVECALKTARKYHAANGAPEREEFIGFEGAFHGRTLATLAATGNHHYLEGFGPPVEGFVHVPMNNLNAVRDAIDGQTAAIMVEPVQGEGGIRSADLDFLRGLRTACDEFGIFLALDEIQCGMGRTGKLFGHEWAGIEPDVISAAKGIGGGFPLGAVLAKEAVGKYLIPGTHGTTYGGNPLACTAGNAVLDVILAPGFLDDVVRKGNVLMAELRKIVTEFPTVFSEARGKGLILGLKCVVPAGEVQAAFTAQGLMTVTAGDNVLRIVPPLVITDSDIAEAVAMMRRGAATCVPAQGAAQAAQ